MTASLDYHPESDDFAVQGIDIQPEEYSFRQLSREGSVAEWGPIDVEGLTETETIVTAEAANELADPAWETLSALRFDPFAKLYRGDPSLHLDYYEGLGIVTVLQPSLEKVLPYMPDDIRSFVEERNLEANLLFVSIRANEDGYLTKAELSIDFKEDENGLAYSYDDNRLTDYDWNYPSDGNLFDYQMKNLVY